MDSSRFDLIEQHIDSFPVLPLTVSRVMEVTSDQCSSAQDLMEVILPDQSLSLTVLKIANSVLFGRPQKVDSLKLAIAILGFNEVRSIAVSKAVFNSFSDLPHRHKPFVDKFWQHSFVCAMAARRIAGELDYQQDIAFMSGLIHDVGKLVMLQTFNDDYLPSSWMARLSVNGVLEEEKRTFSFSHDEVGGQLLSKWNFPDTLITAVSCHHQPSGAVQQQTLTYIVQLADILSFYCCYQDQIREENIVSQIAQVLPGIGDVWEKYGLPLGNDAIMAWYEWLVENQEYGAGLKDMFAA